MRARQAALAIAALALPVLLTACDNFAEDTVVNETEQELITWAVISHCDPRAAHDYDYTQEETVQPRETLKYFTAFSGHNPKCVVATTTDRRLVFSEPYEYGRIYTITPPLRPSGDPLPHESDLPRQPLSEAFSEAPFFASFILAIWFAVVLAIVGGTFAGMRFLYRRFHVEASVVNGGTLLGGVLICAAVWLLFTWWSLTTLFVVDLPALPWRAPRRLPPANIGHRGQTQPLKCSVIPQ